MAQRGECKLTIEEVAQGIEGYFAECDATLADMVAGKTLIKVRRPYTLMGLAVHLGIMRGTLYRWMDGGHVQDVSQDRIDNADPEDRPALTAMRKSSFDAYGTHTPVKDMLSRASDKIGRDIEERAALNTYNPKIACLLLSKHGYTDATSTANVNVQVTWGGATKAQLDDYSG